MAVLCDMLLKAAWFLFTDLIFPEKIGQRSLAMLQMVVKFSLKSFNLFLKRSGRDRRHLRTDVAMCSWQSKAHNVAVWRKRREFRLGLCNAHHFLPCSPANCILGAQSQGKPDPFFCFNIFNKLSLHNDNLLTHTRYFFQQLKHEGFRAAFGCNKSRSSCCC